MDKYVIIGLFAFLVAFGITPLIRMLAPYIGMVDMPDSRRIHTKVTPRGGGLAIFIAFHLGYLLILRLGWGAYIGQLDPIWWQYFLVASGVLLVTGLIDDIFGVRPLVKLTGQALAAGIMVYHGTGVGELTGISIPHWADILVTVFWFLLITNAFNLIDGLDGLATGLGALSALGLFVVCLLRGVPGDALVILLLVGGCIAFLRYNFHPATIFLGDSGSLFIGFTLAAVALEISANSSLAVTLGLPFLALGVPFFDTLLAIWRRGMRKYFPKVFHERPAAGVMEADNEHLHHRILGMGFQQRQVALVLYGVNALVVCVGLLSQLFANQALGIVMIAFLAGVFVVVRHLARTELWDTGRVLISGLHRPPGKVVAFLLYPVLDVIAMSICMVVSLRVTQVFVSEVKTRDLLFDQLPTWVAPVFLSLIAFQIYQRVWSRSRFGDLLFLFFAVGTGCGIALGLSSMLHPATFGTRTFVMALVYGNMVLMVTAGVRLSRRGVQDIMSLVKHSVRFNKNVADSERILLYGAGGRLSLFLREKTMNTLSLGQVRLIVGIVDDDQNLRGRRVNGYRVLGNSEEMMQIIREHAVDRVVITLTCDLAHLNRINHICREANVPLMVWRYEEQTADDFADELRASSQAVKQAEPVDPPSSVPV